MKDIEILEEIYESSCLKNEFNNFIQIFDNKLSNGNLSDNKKLQNFADKLYKSFKHLGHDTSDHEYGSWQDDIYPIMKRFMMYAIVFFEKFSQEKLNQLTEEQIGLMLKKYNHYIIHEFNNDFYKRLHNKEELFSGHWFLDYASRYANKHNKDDRMSTLHALINRCGFTCSPLQVAREWTWIGLLLDYVTADVRDLEYDEETGTLQSKRVRLDQVKQMLNDFKKEIKKEVNTLASA